MRAVILALCAAALMAGCATPSHPPLTLSSTEGLFHDQLFQAPSEPVTAEHIFTVTPAMRRYLQDEVVHQRQGKDLRQALFDALYRKDKLKLEYDSAMTRNAEQAFTARTGNCLSLAIMTAAMARELGVPVTFQRITLDDAWSRSGSLYFSSGHVNLLLGTQKMRVEKGYIPNQFMTVDFIPIPEDARQRAQPLEEKTVVAMYMNNRAAELLVQNRLDDAYWWARQGVRSDPDFLNTYSTLGVIYQRHGDPAAAEQVLRFAHNLDPLNTIFLFNLAQTLDQLHRPDEARALRATLARLEPYPPFYFFNQGQEAMRQGDYVKARQLFQRELDRAPDYHEFHFWLAVASFKLGDLPDADQHMKLALENSTTRGDHDLYAAKLDRIKAYEARPSMKQ